jgi:hypothetical protein
MGLLRTTHENAPLFLSGKIKQTTSLAASTRFAALCEDSLSLFSSVGLSAAGSPMIATDASLSSVTPRFHALRKEAPINMDYSVWSESLCGRRVVVLVSRASDCVTRENAQQVLWPAAL